MENNTEQKLADNSASPLERLVIPHALVKITKASLGSYWYSNEIGRIYFVAKDTSVSFEILLCDFEGVFHKGMKCIEKTDCEILMRAV